MSKIKTLNVKRCVAVFMAVLMMVLSLSYTNDNQIDVIAVSKTRTYWRHNYYSTDLASHYEYNLTVDSYNNSKSRTIFGHNDMVRDKDTSVVRIDGPGGTGFIVGDHEIATAAHCVYSRSNDKFLKFKVSIIDENNNVIKTISPHYVHINKDYEMASEGNSSPYDYAMIYVDEDLSEYGAFNLGVALDSYADKNGSVIVSGFPVSSKYPDGYENSDWGIRFKAKGNIIGKTSDAFQYNADTAGGCSGGPVYIEEGITVNGELHEYKTAIAINKTSGNWGARMTAEVLKLYGDNPYKTE